MSVLENIKGELQKHNTLTVLIIVNVSIFFILNISSSIPNVNIAQYLALPLNLNKFVFKFWTLFTYMFSHKDLGHVFYNLLLLYFTAKTFLNFLNEKKLLYIYIMSGLSGAVSLLLLSAIMPLSFENSILIGASASVLGILTCLAVYIPNVEINIFGILPMKYKYYALLVFALTTIIDFNINTGGKISHFGGAFFGLFFGYMLKNGHDLTNMKSLFKPEKSNLKIVHRNKSIHRNTTEDSNQETIDALLDKISKIGYENLSKDEKDKLFKFSQKNK